MSIVSNETMRHEYFEFQKDKTKSISGRKAIPTEYEFNVCA